MNESKNTLRRGQWFYIILLGVPTFFMPLAYLSMGAWVTYGMFSDDLGDMPELLRMSGDLAVNVTLVMWPVYIAWVVFSTRLNRLGKINWLLVVVILNMVGMPAFYIFIVRRYLGLEGRSHSAALNKFMNRHKLDERNFTSEQLEVLKTYSAGRRQAKVIALPMFLVALILLTGGVTMTVNNFDRLFSDLIGVPSMESETDPESVQEIAEAVARDEEMTRMDYDMDRLIFLLNLSGCAALILQGLILLFQPFSMYLGYMGQKSFMDFLKVTGKGS